MVQFEMQAFHFIIAKVLKMISLTFNRSNDWMQRFSDMRMFYVWEYFWTE
jgi:hypothetical protein